MADVDKYRVGDRVVVNDTSGCEDGELTFGKSYVVTEVVAGLNEIRINNPGYDNFAWSVRRFTPADGRTDQDDIVTEGPLDPPLTHSEQYNSDTIEEILNIVTSTGNKTQGIHTHIDNASREVTDIIFRKLAELVEVQAQQHRDLLAQIASLQEQVDLMAIVRRQDVSETAEETSAW